MKKFIGSFVAIAFAVVAAAPAGAQTVEELQAQIQALLAQISGLSGTTTTVVAPTSCNFTQTLTLGSTGAEVVALQDFLISKGTLTIPAGVSKGYFGGLTQSALASYQAMVGISPAVGYFGPITRAHVNAQCTPVVVVPGTTVPSTNYSGSEASLEDFSMNDGDDEEVEEGSKGQVAEIEFEVEDGDVRVERLDLTFEFSGEATGEDEPWDAFETITLWADGDEIASEDVSDEDDWLEDDGPFVFRFSGLDYEVSEGDMAMIIVEVETQNGIDGAETPGDNDWTIYIDTDDIRALDGAGIDQYIGDSSETVTFGIEEEGGDDELTVNSSTSDPDSTTLKVEDDKTSDDYTVFVFELEADEDSSDLEIDQVTVTIDVAGAKDENEDGDVLDAGEDTAATFDDIVRDYVLVIDGEEFDDLSDNNGAVAGKYTNGTSVTLTFDVDKDFTLDAGDTVDVELVLEFKAANLTNYEAGATVQASIDADGDITAEGADDVDSEGTATGDVHTLEVTGLIDQYSSKSSSPQTLGDDTIALFTFKFDLEAFEDTFYINEDGSDFTVTLTDGTVISTTIVDTTAELTSDDSYRIDEGDSESFTVEVQVESDAAAGTAQSVRATLDSVDYDTDSDLGGTSATLNLGAPDYKSGAVSVIDAA